MYIYIYSPGRGENRKYLKPPPSITTPEKSKTNTEPPKRKVRKMNLLLKGMMFRFHVSFRGSTQCCTGDTGQQLFFLAASAFGCVARFFCHGETFARETFGHAKIASNDDTRWTSSTTNSLLKFKRRQQQQQQQHDILHKKNIMSNVLSHWHMNDIYGILKLCMSLYSVFSRAAFQRFIPSQNQTPFKIQNLSAEAANAGTCLHPWGKHVKTILVNITTWSLNKAFFSGQSGTGYRYIPMIFSSSNCWTITRCFLQLNSGKGRKSTAF